MNRDEVIEAMVKKYRQALKEKDCGELLGSKLEQARDDRIEDLMEQYQPGWRTRTTRSCWGTRWRTCAGRPSTTLWTDTGRSWRGSRTRSYRADGTGRRARRCVGSRT
jgi:hypothetical protein